MQSALATPISNSTSLVSISDASKGQAFFKPVKVNEIVHLLDTVAIEKQKIALACQFFKEGGDVAFFRLLSASKATLSSKYNDIFNVERGSRYCDAQSWQKALSLLDVYDYMPTAKRKEWDALIEEQNTPEFIEENVVPTLVELLNQRELFLSEVVSDIFFGLSGDHVTNKSWGFTKRMIMPSQFGKGNAEPTSTVKSLIGDLRAIIAKMHNRPVAGHKNNEATIDACRYLTGKWVEIDGGAVRLKVFKVGTVHIEIHPDVAWRLNEILATKYPSAIPAQHRKPQVRRSKIAPLRYDIISQHALTIMSHIRVPRINIGNDYLERFADMDGNVVAFDSSYAPRALRDTTMAEVVAVCEYLGAKRVSADTHEYAVRFPDDVNVKNLLNEVVATGTLPEKKSHQFFPTPPWLGDKAKALLDVQEGDEVFDPSVGRGALVEGLSNVTCIDISPVHCAIMRSKGANVIEGDFEALHAQFVGRFHKKIGRAHV